MKRIFWALLLLISLCLVFSGCGEEEDGGDELQDPSMYAESDDFLLELIDGGDSYAIYDVKNLGATELTVPHEFNGIPITEIYSGAFGGCKSLKNLTVPDSIRYIGEGAFGGCSSLEKITLPFVGSSDVIETTDYATLFGVVFGTYDYDGGRQIYQEYYLTNPSSTHTIAFYIPESLTSVTVNRGDIGKGAFKNCTNIKNVTLGKGVKSIKSMAFQFSGIESITIPEGVTRVENSTFYGCSSLKNVTLPVSITKVDYDAFNFCRAIENVYVSNIGSWLGIMFDGKNSNPLYYDARLIVNGSHLTELTVPQGITEIKSRAFDGYAHLTKVNIPEGVTKIGNYTFSDCDGISSVIFSEGLTEIGKYAFSSCDSLTSLTLPKSLSSIAERAFSESIRLESINIDQNNSYYSSVDGSLYTKDNKTLVQYAIGKKADSFDLPITVENISAAAFKNCQNLKKINICSSLKFVDDAAFYDCDTLTDVYIKDLKSWCEITFASVESNPVYYAHSMHVNGIPLTELTVPEGITNIKSYAFAGCTTLGSVNISDGVTEILRSAFYNCYGITTVTVGKNVERISDFAFYECNKIIEIINKSSLDIKMGSYEYGEIASKAIAVHNGESLIVNRNGYLFITLEGVNYLISYVGTQSEITLPVSYNTESYVVNEFAFYYNPEITKITISDGVSAIGLGAFRNCSDLEEVVFSDGDWYITRDKEKYLNKEGGIRTDVSNSSFNATDLKDEGNDYYWYKH